MHIERKTRFRMLLRPVVFAFVATLTSAIPLEAHAETVHHWRFEDGAFLEDSVGTAVLSNTTVTQADLSTIDPVSAFPVPVGAGENGAAADFQDTGGLAGDITPLLGSWTVEMLVRTRNLNGVYGQALFNNAVDRCNSPGNVGMQFRMDGLGGTSRGELAVFSGTPGGAQTWLPLGFIPELGKDYYFGFVHDDPADTLTFHVQNLTDMGTLSSTGFEFVAYGFPDATDVEIGNISGGACGADSHAHDGLMDEVRISDVALSVPELFVSDGVFRDGFESAPQ